jgi:hypothetical protein
MRVDNNELVTLGALLKPKKGENKMQAKLYLGDEMFQGKIIDLSAKYSMKGVVVEHKGTKN